MAALLVAVISLFFSSSCWNLEVVEASVQYDHNFNPRTYRNPGKVDYHVDLDSMIDGAVHSDTSLRSLYQHYKAKHSVSHDERETTQRLRLFRQFLIEIQELRANPQITWTPGITLMAHRTEPEKRLMTAGNITHVDNSDSGGHRTCHSMDLEQTRDNVLQAHIVPASFDWRAVGGVTPVKEQGEGDCWAYSAVTPLEAQIKTATGTLHELSTQELVDCVFYGEGRESFEPGGQPYVAWGWIKTSGRIGYRAQIPVRAEGGFYSCSYNKWARNALAENHLEMGKVTILSKKYANEKIITLVVSSTTPVAVLISTQHGDFEKYAGGPFDPRASNCIPGEETNHAVALVGYDREYYYIKNSWGDHWGNDGYIWWVRSKGVRDCGLHRTISYPKLNAVKRVEKNEKTE